MIPKPAMGLLISALCCAQLATALAQNAAIPSIIAKVTADLERLDGAVSQMPDSVPLRSRRGDCHLFLAHFREAVADFEAMIALDPAQDAPHWRLGIAYYFEGEFAKAAKQFEKYHAYDGGDRENGIWKFLSQARAAGIEKARDEMLVYTRFDREPFPALYEMFAGRRTTDDLFRDLAARGLTADSRVMFFANYYAGLNEALLGHRDRAIELTRKAVAADRGKTAGSGPAYM